jgi:NhaP-type Na+/H+ or K+/H+ antiporter
MIQHDMMVTIVATIVLGVAAQVIAEKQRIPSIIFLLAFGIVAGPDVFNVVQPGLLGEGLFEFTALAVAIILFEGGLTLEIRNVRHVSRSVFNLITVGALVTWAGAALSAWLILDVSPRTAILFGSLVIVTGPTVIGPLLRTVKVNRSIRTILRWEGILIDPVGAIIAVLVFEFILSAEPTLVGTLAGFIGRIMIGVLLGLAGGWALTRLMRLNLGETLNNLVVFAFVFLTFGLSELVIRESGIMSVTIAGIVLGNLGVPNLGNIRGFKEKLTVLLVSCLFVVLAANLRLADVASMGFRGVLVVLVLMLIVRPLNIWSSVREKSVTLNEKVFLGLIAPRGIVAAAVASLFSFTMVKHGLGDSTLISSLTFLTIGMTVFVQGIWAGPLSRLLNVRKTGTSGVLILGGNGLTVELAGALTAANIPAAIMDSNPGNLFPAENKGIPTFRGDALDPETWDNPEFGRYGAFLAATTNNELNSLACLAASEQFDREKVFQVRNARRGGDQKFSLSMIRGNEHYDCALDIAHVSDVMVEGKARLVSVGGDALGREGLMPILGLQDREVLFSTDREVLGGATSVLAIDGDHGGGH